MPVIYALILIFMCPSLMWAACSASGLSYTAASGSYADVKACADLIDTNSAYGATLNIPAADGSAEDWTSSIVITKNIRIIGAGIDVTKITSRVANPSNLGMAVITFAPDSTSRTNLQAGGSGLFEITGITVTGYATSPPHNLSAFGLYNPSTPVASRIRIHHNKVVNMWAFLGGGNGAETGTNLGYVGGSIDNNYVVDSEQLYYTGMTGAVFPTNYRVYPGDGQGLYIEDNVVTFDHATANYSMGWFTGGNNSGMAAILRYNIFSGHTDTASGVLYVDSHSNQIGISGGQLLEAYGNNWTLTDTTYGYISMSVYMRGQKNIYLYNIMNNSNNGIYIVEEYNDHFSADPLPEGICTSRTNEEGTKQVCPGYIIGTPDNCFCWKVHDSYFMNNRLSNGNLVPVTKGMDRYHENNNLVNDPPEVDEDVEYFNHKALATFQGDPAHGVSCGTLAQMNAITPSVVGVGFWVPTNIDTMPCTSVSANNIKQAFLTNPVTPITGTLYKWDGNSWEAFWVPYTYPHPLRGEVAETASIRGVTINGMSVR